MMTRLLFLSVAWFLISFAGVLVGGARLRRVGFGRMLLWLLLVIALGDAYAYLTFGVPREIFIQSAIALSLGIIIYGLLPDWNAFGQVGLLMTLLATVTFLAYTFLVVAFTPLSVIAYLLAMGFFFLQSAALLLALTHAYESFEAATRVVWRRRPENIPPVPGYAPMVSFHVPAYNEPPDVLAKTLGYLARLDYPHYEVLVIDNNTPEEETWRAVKELCDRLGPKFRFLHLDKWPGYKSGALNFALTQTDPAAELIAVVDADYHIEPNFLRDTVGAFVDPKMAFIQTPQDFRDFRGNRFGETIYDSYRYFFQVSMPARNEHNAIIFCGTMGLIRKPVLQEIGGWDEWCITEDAEASLRILKKGYTSLYLNRTYGRGLLPLEFDGMKKQRFRWCFGGIQILRKHWESLMPWARLVDPDNHLTGAQRYFYLFGGLQWYTDLMNLFFVFYLVLGGLYGLFFRGTLLQPLTGPLIVIPVVYLVLNVWRFAWLLHSVLGLPWRRAFGSMYSFFAMGWAVALADLQGLRKAEGVFLRTPKSASDSKALRALRVSLWEAAIGVLCIAVALLLVLLMPLHASNVFLAGLLTWQSSLYLSAPVLSLMSAFSRTPATIPVAQQVKDLGRPAPESGLGQIALATAVALALVIGVAQLLPRPSQPSYSAYEPPQIPAQNLVIGAPTATPTLLVPMTPTSTETPATATIAPTGTLAATETATSTLTPTATTAATAAPTATATTAVTPTLTLTATTAVTPTPTLTATATATPAATATATASVAPTLAATATITPTATMTAAPPSTATFTPAPTATPTQTPLVPAP